MTIQLTDDVQVAAVAENAEAVAVLGSLLKQPTAVYRSSHDLYAMCGRTESQGSAEVRLTADGEARAFGGGDALSKLIRISKDGKRDSRMLGRVRLYRRVEPVAEAIVNPE